MTRCRSARGFSLVEMTIASLISLVITGAIFALVNASTATSRAQPEASDMQQRARVAIDALYRDLIMAAAGPYHGSTTGSLASFFAPVLPYRTGQEADDPASGVYYRADAITIVYVPNTPAQATTRDRMSEGSDEIEVNPQANCPIGDQLCGFREGMGVLIFDATGAWDAFEITGVQTSALHVQHRGAQVHNTYEAGSFIVEGQFDCYYLDEVNSRLMHYDGIQTELPVADNVVALQFRYYGDPNPPAGPKPPIGAANCLFDASGQAVLPALPATSGLLVELTPDVLQDGPWCGDGASTFDADLLRLRAVRVSIRAQVASPGLRGPKAMLLPRPGAARGAGYVSDFSTVFEVSPRNLNLAR